MKRKILVAIERHTPTQRTPEQTFIGTFWAYEGHRASAPHRDFTTR